VFEWGKMAPHGNKYFYVKAHNNIGWLFETSAAGWVISPSEKIVGRDLFIRKGGAFDIANLYSSNIDHMEGIVNKRIKIQSSLDSEPLPLSLYIKKTLDTTLVL
jgi:hypothetical protein